MNGVTKNALRDTKKLTSLFERCNKFGDYKVCKLSKEGGTPWISVLYAWENPDERWKLLSANNRTLFKHEVVGDLDPHKDEERVSNDRLINAIKKVKKYEPNYFEVWFSGSRGYHLHIFDESMMLLEEQNRNRIRKHVLSRISADLSLASEKHMIALEHALHHKTGRPKIKICDSNGYWNSEFFLESEDEVFRKCK